VYLKTLEITGFKSFPDKTVINFGEGITSIVGPNGSGKSNISDAIRWVLGEQSTRTLRGNKMEDVIFAGTALRKGAGFAEVALTIDNAAHILKIDYDLVTIARRYYRSGESEYIINDNQCRLKDINELFYDTGIGKEGYSIIGQGQIDKILSGKPEERRELFDEAAGIVKFKKRKNVTLKKLDSERESMVRITDIMTELERQVGPLARQSETAKTYLKLRDELKTYDLNAFLLDHKSMSEQLTKTEENLDIVNRDIREREQEDADLKKEYADIDETIARLDERIEGVRTSAGESGTLWNTLEGRINVVSEQINTEKTNTEHYETRLREIDAEIAEKDQAVTAGQEEAAAKREELLQAEQEAQEKQEELKALELKVSLYRNNIEESHGKVVDLLNEKTETAARLQHLNTLLEQNALRLSEYAGRVSELDEKGAELNAVIAGLEEKNAEAEKNLSELEEELSRAQEELKEAEEGYNDVQHEINDCMQRYQIAKSRLDTLKSMAERYEGFNAAIRRVMDVRHTYGGVCGVIADLISVDNQYQTAIETALGGAVQNIVTETENDAKRYVQYLKENRAGRATFLPLDSIRPGGGVQDKKVFSERGVIGTADTLVKRDAKYDRAIRYLLERFLVVDTIDNALAVAKKYRYTLRIVTLDGESLNVGGSITGGAFKTTNNVLGRNSELESIEKEANENRDKAEALKKKLNQYRQLRESTIVEIDDIQEDVRTANKEFAEVRAELDSKRREISMLALEKKENESRISEAEEEKRTAEIERDTISEAVNALENAGSENTDTADQTKALLEEAEAALAIVRTENDALNLKCAGISQSIDFLTENGERLIGEIEHLQDDKERFHESVAESGEAVRERLQEIEELKAQLQEAKESASGFEETLKSLTEEREAFNASQHEFFNKRDALSSMLNDLTREQLRLQAQQEKLEEKLESQTEYLWSEYELVPSEAENYRDESLDLSNPQGIRRHAQELKSQIKALGNVNVNSIDQYKEVSERYEFLKGQYDDLVTAEQSLVDIVNELDEGMRQQFKEKYEQICVEYDRIFKELFGGGQGTIVLEEGADIIDADITIISQPPGKKLQNMMQLSGGEKALSAIALIFAIQSLKPSPFCLLDEIEAALDDSNVGRFNGYLHNLTDFTQFILITHRRGTMVAADRLYGITMQEKGVSTLVSVNLVEQDLDE